MGYQWRDGRLLSDEEIKEENSNNFWGNFALLIINAFILWNIAHPILAALFVIISLISYIAYEGWKVGSVQLLLLIFLTVVTCAS